MPKSKHNKPRTTKGTWRNPIKSKEDRYVEEHHQGSHSITKREFMSALTKAATPVSEWHKPVPVKKQTSESHPSDGCTDTHTNQDKTGDKEG